MPTDVELARPVSRADERDRLDATRKTQGIAGDIGSITGSSDIGVEVANNVYERILRDRSAATNRSRNVALSPTIQVSDRGGPTDGPRELFRREASETRLPSGSSNSVSQTDLLAILELNPNKLVDLMQVLEVMTQDARWEPRSLRDPLLVVDGGLGRFAFRRSETPLVGDAFGAPHIQYHGETAVEAKRVVQESDPVTVKLRENQFFDALNDSLSKSRQLIEDLHKVMPPSEASSACLKLIDDLEAGFRDYRKTQLDLSDLLKEDEKRVQRWRTGYEPFFEEKSQLIERTREIESKILDGARKLSRVNGQAGVLDLVYGDLSSLQTAGMASPVAIGQRWPPAASECVKLYDGFREYREHQSVREAKLASLIKEHQGELRPHGGFMAKAELGKDGFYTIYVYPRLGEDRTPNFNEILSAYRYDQKGRCLNPEQEFKGKYQRYEPSLGENIMAYSYE